MNKSQITKLQKNFINFLQILINSLSYLMAFEETKKSLEPLLTR